MPPARAGELLAFDGSVILDRTAGQIGARCDHAAYNMLTLNLAVEIIEGRRTVEDAGRFYGETAARLLHGQRSAVRPEVAVQPGDRNRRPGRGDHRPSMGRQMVEKVKDVFGAGNTPQ